MKPSNAPALPVIATEVVLPGIVEPAGLKVRHRPLPAPESGRALVRVEATGISFAEQGMRRGRYPGQPKFPFVPGYDLVGTVDAVGDAADGKLVGRRAAAATKTGGWASHALVPVVDLVPVPAGLDPAEVAAVLDLLASGVITAHVAARFPLTRAGAAMELAESRTVLGEVILQP